MKQNQCYQVRCRVTTAEMSCGQVVATQKIEHNILSDTYEVSEVFADLYEQFRSPQLLGLQIVSIQGCLAEQYVPA